ncbi:MAG: GldG family protein [Tolypothrix brevis GSE-NOS-MK-07-07A]|nr:GldG family protein [Tolypothrix brevis GSE-NOS-MK-07-07A]
MKKILFDESHQELLRSQQTNDADTWTELRSILTEELKYEVLPPVTSETASLTEQIFDERLNADVLILAAPTQIFTDDEVEAITYFVRAGKSLLIANNYYSLQPQEHWHKINKLLESFGLHAQQLVSYPHEKVSNLHPHYLSSGVRRLAIKDPTYLKLLNDAPQVVATLPETGKPFLTAVEANRGRVVAVGDFSLFGDSYIQKDDNRMLALNIFRWLAYDNFLDFGGSYINSEVIYGRTEVFSATLINSYLQKRLEGIRCSLESDSVALIENQSQEVHPLLVGEKSQLKWIIEPRQLGSQSLRLKVDFPENLTHPSLTLNPIVEFKCVPDAEFSLVVRDSQAKELQTAETGVAFNVQAVVRWNLNAKQVPLQLVVDCPLAPITVEQTEADRWRLTAIEAGNWTIRLTIKETDQKITRTIEVHASPQFKIAKIERSIVSTLAAKVHHRISQILPEFDIDVIRQIPFQLLTPEDQVRKIYPPDIQERLLEALQAARSETEEFTPLVDELLLYIAPVYSPQHGCCIPYDPKLAAHLIQKYPSLEKNIAYNFLCVEGHDLYGQTWLEGNIAALLLHEKYGHGFFYTQTKLGQQLAIIYRHGLLRKLDSDRLRSPYLRSIHQEYGQVIQMLNHSALLLNEGFATWLELTGLQRLSGIFEQTVHRRKEFLFQDTQLEILVPRSEYLRRFNPGPGSKYQIMYDRLKSIQSFFSYLDPDFGIQCAVQAMSKAADIDFGISEQDGQIQFKLSADKIKELLFDDRKDYEAGADRRIRRIWRILKDYSEQFQDHQAQLQWQNAYLHATFSMVNKIIEEKLGW